jgi:hypothetical protein
MLTIKKIGNQFIAFTSSDLEENKEFGPLLEYALKKELFALGYHQGDIDQAFYNSAPDYFGVGKW